MVCKNKKITEQITEKKNQRKKEQLHQQLYNVLRKKLGKPKLPLIVGLIHLSFECDAINVTIAILSYILAYFLTGISLVLFRMLIFTYFLP